VLLYLETSVKVKDIAVTYEPNKETTMEKTLGRHDTKHNNIMKQMKEKATIKNLGNETEHTWKPFSNTTQEECHGDLTKCLGYLIEGSEIVGATQFWDIMCPLNANEMSQQFEKYCVMSIDSATEPFFKSFYSLSDNEKVLLDSACKWMFDVLLKGFKVEIKKTKSRMAQSYNAWVYSTIWSHPGRVAIWISNLPPSLQMELQYGPSLLLEIIINIFQNIVLKATNNLSCILHCRNITNAICDMQASSHTNSTLHPSNDNCKNTDNDHSNDHSNNVTAATTLLHKDEDETMEVQIFWVCHACIDK